MSRIRAKSKNDTKRIILERIAGGDSVLAICRDKATGITSRTFWRWITEDSDFAAKYDVAIARRAEKYGEEIAAIGDEEPPLVDGRVDIGWIQWQRLRVDSRKWIAGKLLPKKYGERTVIAGDADNPLHVEHSNAVEALLSLPALGNGVAGTTGEDGETIQ